MCTAGTSLVRQRVRTRLPRQGTRVPALVPEDPTCRGATEARVPWQPSSAAREATAGRSLRRNQRKPGHGKEDPAWPQTAKRKKISRTDLPRWKWFLEKKVRLLLKDICTRASQAGGHQSHPGSLRRARDQWLSISQNQLLKSLPDGFSMDAGWETGVWRGFPRGPVAKTPCS